MADGYRMAAGTLTVAELDATYAVNRFPVQTDQGGLLWFSPLDPGSSFRQATAYRDALNGTRRAFGKLAASWVFGKLTTGMVDYLYDTFFSPSYSATVTIRTFDRATGWRVINCLALWNEPADSAEQDSGGDGYIGLRIDFINGEDADAE